MFVAINVSVSLKVYASGLTLVKPGQQHPPIKRLKLQPHCWMPQQTSQVAFYIHVHQDLQIYNICAKKTYKRIKLNILKVLYATI